MHCAICGQAILRATEPVVPTTTGDLVHLGSADRDARAAYHSRTFRAIISAALLIGLFLLATCTIQRGDMLLMLFIILVVGHVRLNKRWWSTTTLICHRHQR